MANKETLQRHLNANYDLEFFQRNVLQPVFGNNLTIASVPEKRNINPSEERLIKSVKKYGTIALTDYRELDLYDVELAQNVVIERSKVSIGAAIKKYIFANNAVLVNFHYQNQPGKSWRLSFIAKEQQIEEGEIVKGETHPKRYTYVLGQHETCRTAAERFARLSLETELTIDKLKEAFSVEKLSKKFFDDYKEHYLLFVEHLNKRNFKAVVFNGDEKAIRDFAKKLLGRIVFLYFVQKKGWLGASSTKYTDGSPDFLQELFISSGRTETFYNQWLKKLFYDSLNNPNRTNDDFKLPDQKTVKIPFLNGGLFEDDDPRGILTFPPKLFADLFEFFNQYNFTIYEDSPDDHTIAVDPEMLGHIFENLLEDNKDKGAYYTPKEIVHYMCQESLIEYLSTKLEATSISGEAGRKTLEQFIKHKQINDEIKKHAKEINKYLDEVKICDPAIGSGAFPMGLLHEIFNAKQLLNSETGMDAAAVKQNIIQNSIYGVDIEQGAVDIARLRFWLSLIVDEDMPRPLPNLDYKIVAGDSLVPKFEGEVVDIDWDLRDGTSETKQVVEKIKNGLNEIVAEQKKFFGEENPDKKKKFAEKIRNHKIDLLINQLIFDKLKYKARNTVTHQLFEQTSKDKQRELEIKMKIAGYDSTIKKLQTLRSKPDKPLKFFDWKLEFAEIMNPAVSAENCGFDIVIGNPPWGGGIDDDLVFLKKNFPETTGEHTDSFKIFLDAGLKLDKENGCLTMIVPNTVLRQRRLKDVRKILLKKTVIAVVNLGENIFEEVVAPSCIIVARNTSFTNSHLVKYTDVSKLPKALRTKQLKELNESILIPQVDFLKNPDLEFSKSFIAISVPIKALGEFQFYSFKDVGIQCQRKNVGKEARTKSDLATKIFIERKVNSNSEMYWKGRDFDRYSIRKDTGRYFRKDYKQFLKPNEVVYFNALVYNTTPKIILRQTADHIVACLDFEKRWFDGSVIGFIPNEPSKYNIEYMLGLLNSSFFKWYYQMLVDEEGRVFAQVKLSKLKQMPIRIINFEHKGELELFNLIVGLVQKILKVSDGSQGQIDKQFQKLDSQIDFAVYKLYQLTYDEVLVVDKEFEKQMSREEYDKLDYGFEYIDPQQATEQPNGKKKSKGKDLSSFKEMEF